MYIFSGKKICVNSIGSLYSGVGKKVVFILIDMTIQAL